MDSSRRGHPRKSIFTAALPSQMHVSRSEIGLGLGLRGIAAVINDDDAVLRFQLLWNSLSSLWERSNDTAIIAASIAKVCHTATVTPAHSSTICITDSGSFNAASLQRQIKILTEGARCD